jgi:hypothetical protein
LHLSGVGIWCFLNVHRANQGTSSTGCKDSMQSCQEPSAGCPGHRGDLLHVCHRLLAGDGTDDWVPPQSHGPLMPTVFCHLYLYLYLQPHRTHLHSLEVSWLYLLPTFRPVLVLGFVKFGLGQPKIQSVHRVSHQWTIWGGSREQTSAAMPSLLHRSARVPLFLFGNSHDSKCDVCGW